MPAFTVHQAKTQLSRLLAQIRRGGEVFITEGRAPVARLVPIARAGSRRPGALKGKTALTPAFFDPSAENEVTAWGEE